MPNLTLAEEGRKAQQIFELNDEGALWAILGDNSKLDPERSAALLRLVELVPDLGSRPGRLRLRDIRQKSKSEALRSLIIKYRASLEIPKPSTEKKGETRKRVVSVTSTRPTLGSIEGDTTENTWREDARDDESPLINKMARLRD